jgi:hypothetical protein
LGWRGDRLSPGRSQDALADDGERFAMKQAAALAISFEPVDYDLRDIVPAE